MNNNKGILEARIKQMAEGNYKEMDKEFSLDDFDPKPAEKQNHRRKLNQLKTRNLKSQQPTRKSL